MASTITMAPVQTIAATPNAAPARPTSPAQYASQAADKTLGAPTTAAPVSTSGDADAARSAAVLKYAQDKVGQQDGNGECYTLADNALRAAGAKSAPDYGKITPTADYKWGKSVPLDGSKPGDILQFKDYKNTTKTTQEDGSWQTETQTRPHHTAVVVDNDGKGNITVLEQNVPHGGETKTTVLHFGNGTTKGEDGSTTTSKTTGSVKAYHPEAQETK